jgi:hypothetical protein
MNFPNANTVMNSTMNLAILPSRSVIYPNLVTKIFYNVPDDFH